VAEQVKEVLPNALDVSLDYERSEAPARPEGARRSLRPEELFADFFERKNGVRPSPEMLALFKQVHEDAHAPQADTREMKIAAGGLR
jgi:hypothetical protein